METKQIAAIVLVLLAAGIAYYFLATAPAQDGPAVDEPQTGGAVPPFAKEGENATMQEFAANLLAAETVYIVEDVRGLEKYPLSRTHVMQCGVDYAGSQGLAGKELVVYAFDDDDVCGTVNGTASIDKCYSDVLSASEDPATMIIWIEKGSSPEIYSRGMVVRINETYVQGSCTTSLVSPSENEEEEPLLPDVNISEMEGPGPVIINETENGNADEEEEEPGDSHTFP
ncbi:hypothetical protein GF412_03330 [Candidatus Micrarchaeota archaeon]|nr:hypothetical protein [Candidatus Micrarchaeota archaeon]MBD3417984.1 hypothetical protein [Candidatus Micrarchaeota archaeon]